MKIITSVVMLFIVNVLWSAEYSYDATEFPEGVISAEFDLYLPPSVDNQTTSIRGILVTQNYFSGAQAYRGADWRQLAEDNRLALCMILIKNPEPHGQGRMMDKDPEGAQMLVDALDHFAETTGNPSLKNAGLIFTGVSQGGWVSVAYSIHLSDRTICAVPVHESTASRASSLNNQSDGWGIPMLHLMGENDGTIRPSRVQPWVLGARENGALWSTQLQEGVGHDSFAKTNYAREYIETLVDLRVGANPPLNEPHSLLDLHESSGWYTILSLNNNSIGSAAIARADTYAGDPEKAGWVPTEELARSWLNEHGGGEVSIKRGVVSAQSSLSKKLNTSPIFSVTGRLSQHGKKVLRISVSAGKKTVGNNF